MKSLDAHGLWGFCGGAVGWSTALQAGKSRVPFPMVSVEFFITVDGNDYTGKFSGGLSLAVRRAENLTTFIWWFSWNLGASTSRNPLGLYRDRFTFCPWIIAYAFLDIFVLLGYCAGCWLLNISRPCSGLILRRHVSHVIGQQAPSDGEQYPRRAKMSTASHWERGNLLHVPNLGDKHDRDFGPFFSVRHVRIVWYSVSYTLPPGTVGNISGIDTKLATCFSKLLHLVLRRIQIRRAPLKRLAPVYVTE